MGAAFEVNRQMCDIDKHLSEAGYFRKICEGQIEARKKLIDMEKKKMTKAEAFEYLKGKKILVDCHPNVILKKLFDIGLKWVTGDTEIGDWCELEMYGLVSQDKGLVWYHQYTTESKMRFESLDSEKILASDILSIEIVEGTPEFSYDKVVELAKPLMEYLNDTGWMEQIGVSYDHIVAQPMATFLYGEKKGC